MFQIIPKILEEGFSSPIIFRTFGLLVLHLRKLNAHPVKRNFSFLYNSLTPTKELAPSEKSSTQIESITLSTKSTKSYCLTCLRITPLSKNGELLTLKTTLPNQLRPMVGSFEKTSSNQRNCRKLQ